ncbi:glycosyltransferase family 4 protein [Sphaerospermopsis kisseleviana CS-549]|uniref:Glycosyltransferase family 4 protein n=1 Tax=Sphaerospermopsis kisseleviana CS-549 TaxID=3021783 RepID=A0ABT4ZYS2_9CYAN|nr:glycosyltransferase family 4 protein [Sphaerospermopsis kisseleviana]MDB9444572.1 glycosyltransferase family 4 protein [Sphaerospermopsis kisseleviana CS-549]BAZ82204.1 group 1 glycosyl transferase [Sphaerospermopsis kisseleviana NIES-73]
MEHISQLGTQIREKTACPDILVISRIFHPQEAVIGEYIYNRCLQDPDRVIVLAAGCCGDKIFDKSQQFPVYRWTNLSLWLSLFGGNFLSIIIKPLFNFFNFVCSLLLAIRLYFRYHYRYIEWCHGYDFPALLLLSYILPIRFFIYLHGNDLVDISRHPLWRFLLKITLKRAEGIVCNNSYIRETLRNIFRLDTPTHVINPIVRLEKFGTPSNLSHLDDLRIRLRQTYNISETAIVILSVGKLIKNKNFDKVIDNIPLLLTIGVDVHYIICGIGLCEQQLKSQCQRLRVDKRVHFAGNVPERELANYYAACDIFAMLNLQEDKARNIDNFDNFDNFEIVHLEAGYFGKPVIASRLGSILDAVHHEENGLLVDPNSGYEVLQAFKRLCQDQQLREKLGRQGQELAKRKTYHRWLYNPESRYSCLLN